MEDTLKPLENEVYKCPGCGSNLSYNPATSTLECTYCSHKIKIDGERSSAEKDFLTAAPTNNWQSEAHVVHCQNCGANNVIDNKSISNACPYCGSSSVVSTDELPGERPHRVIPFGVSQEQAFQLYTKWLKKKIFVPGVVKKKIPQPIARGVYVPSWTYDSNTFSSYEGRLGEHYTVTVGSGKDARTVTKTRYFRIRGVHNMFHDDVLVCSGQKIGQNELLKLSPYNTNQSFVYDARYLPGFAAEHYSLNVQQGWNVARNAMDARIKSGILRKYHYDVVDYLNVKTNFMNITYKYVLLPVWICQYTVGKKTYNFRVNGETGKVVGKVPYSSFKITITVFGILLLVFILIMLYFLLSSGAQTNF